MEFDFTKEPGKTLQKIDFENKEKVLVSIIMPFYNSKNYIRQTVNSVLNQTFPCFELIIIDDGSKDEESLKVLDEVEKLDDRIKVFHKENEGLAATRDFGASKASEESKYLFFLDDDDLIEPTYLECAYWTLETNQKATWAYTNSVGFGGTEYTWNVWFSSGKMKKQNDLVATSMIRKSDFWEVNGYELREKAVNEDWNFWLKLIAKEKFPVRMSFYGFWYRRKDTGELNKSVQNKARAMQIIEATAKNIKKEVEAIQYPNYTYDWEEIVEHIENEPKIKRKDNGKTNILMIIPWMVMGGADKYNLDLVQGLDKDKFDITIITTEPAKNMHRQKFEEFATVYDLTTFLSERYWLSFINYIIEKNNISIIFNTNSETGYSMLPYLKATNPNVPIIDYVHMEEWYWRNGGYSRDSSSVASVIDKTLTCNEGSRRVFIKDFKRKPEEIQTVYIGVDENKFAPDNYDKNELREKYNVTQKYVIGYICRITEQKRPYLLLQVINKLKAQRDDFTVLVAGTGNLYNKIRNKANNLELGDSIRFIGNVEETQKFYIACDLTLNCSIKEGLALTSYESLAMGVPVISSDVGGQKELINEDVGVIVPCVQDENDIFKFEYSDDEIGSYVDAVNKILGDLDKYKSNCRKRILDGFTINHMLKNMADIFDNITEKPNEEKIQNGKALSKTTDITKELIVKHFVANRIKYEWECAEYNKKHETTKNNYKFQLFKDRMWRHAWYRGLIRLLQKTRIINKIKRITKVEA